MSQCMDSYKDGLIKSTTTRLIAVKATVIRDYIPRQSTNANKKMVSTLKGEMVSARAYCLF